ncbi:MAG: tRNA (guanosine(37)-N1)-methyltransferase TrmD [Deltaproteobacteria bacterium]|nr:tRNA (guanosine(37)-N1)-methyltransferase TrmD [Deltaproteobacteria bacterium]
MGELTSTRFDVLTLFPGFFVSPLKESIIGRAVSKGLIEIHTHNIRDFAVDKHKTTDDAPYGGGHGMVMKVEPVAACLEAVSSFATVKQPGNIPHYVILTTPQGVPLRHEMAKALVEKKRIAIICGRYEGVDERIRGLADAEVSVGDYVLTGGEIPALAIIDAVSRFVPGVLGSVGSTEEESFAGNGGITTCLLEYPQYTRPVEWRGQTVPEALLSGNHAEIKKWRRRESVRRTFERRPDLLKKADLSEADLAYVDELKKKG